MYVCESCRQPLSDDEPVIAGAVLVDASNQDGPGVVEGPGVFFHPHHTPHDSGNRPGYRIRGQTTVREATRR